MQVIFPHYWDFISYKIGNQKLECRAGYFFK